jgi:hypothetical protein
MTVFKTSTTTLDNTQGTVDQQSMESFKDKMTSGDKTVDISNSKLSIKAGSTKQTFIGFRNDDVTVDYNFTISAPVGSNITLGACNPVSIEYKKEATVVGKGGQISLLPINAKVPAGVAPGTCSYDVAVNYGSLGTEKSARVQLVVDIE